MTQPPPTPTDLIIDQEAIENLRELSPDDGDVFLKEILSIFLTDTPERIADLHRYRESGDISAFIRAAHSIKGSSSNVGAVELRAMAEKLEHLTRKHGFSENNQNVKEIELAFARARTILLTIIG